MVANGLKIVRYGLIVFLLALTAQATQIEYLFILDYVLIGVFVLSFIWTYFSLRFLQVERSSYADRAQVGETFIETLSIRNRSFLPRLWLEVQDGSELPGHAQRVNSVQSLWAFGEVSWQAKTYCALRGRFQLGPLTLAAGDPFGLFRFKRQFKAHHFLTVYPATFELHRFEVLSGVLPGGNPVSRPSQHTTPSINGLRDYQPGDSLNRIHWASSARHGKLVVKEFDFDPTADVEIFLDMNVAAHWLVNRGTNGVVSGALPARVGIRSHDSTEEYAVTSAATLARHFLNMRRNVGLISAGQHHVIVPPDRGERQLIKLLESLAIIRAQGKESFAELISGESHRLGSTDTVLLVTADMSENWVGVLPLLLHRKVKVAVVLVEPQTFGGGESSLMLVGALTAINVPVFLVKRGDDLSQALDSEMQRLSNKL